MKRIALLAVGVCALALSSATAQNTIVTATYNDWTNWDGGGSGGWFGYTVNGTNTFDYGNITINGIGNPTNAGGTGIAGSLKISPVQSGWGPAVSGPGATTALLTALDGPGAASGSSLATQSGTLYVDFTMPACTNAGTYFQLGIYYDYSANWGAWWPSSQIDLGPVSTPDGTMEMYEAAIPYTISNVDSLGYFHLGFFQNTDYHGSNSWYIAGISVAPLPIAIIPAPITPLFTTSDDFGPWASAGGDLIQADNTWSVDTNALNGAGNTNAPGGSDASGSLLVYWSSVLTGWGAIATLPDEEYNAAFLQAIDPGCDPATQTSVAAYGNIYLDYSQPDNTDGGSYFQLGLNFAYNANGYNSYSPFWWNSTADLGFQDGSGYEVYRATIPYTIMAGHFYGFATSLFVNSDYQPTNGFHVDAITVNAAQAPLITGASLNGSSLVIQGTNGLAGFQFTLLTSTNLALPLNQWTVVSAGNAFAGPTFNITNTINPANAQTFYSIKVP